MQFVFDRDFDGEMEVRARRSDVRIGAVYTEQEYEDAIEAAQKQAYEDGRMAGRTEAAMASAQSDQERQLSALESLTPAMAALLQDADRHHAVLEAQMLDFVLSVFDRVAPQVMETQAKAQVEREVDNAIRMALGSAILRVFFAPSVHKEGEVQVQRTARLQGYGGRIEVSPDPELAEGDVRVEWDHGVMRYSFNDICQRILGALGAAKDAAEARTGQSEDQE
ncbi:hypothetical protein [Pseudooceanicola sp.]|jgi:flagellar assembly protein FliH|uniref:hypothetical protein n=1 Tax=Pseudooceanicola sp. TaxID=1914328 RepID=UPI00405A10BE